MSDSSERPANVRRSSVWRRRRRARGGLVVSLSLKSEERIKLDRLCRACGIGRQDALRQMIDTAYQQLETDSA